MMSVNPAHPARPQPDRRSGAVKANPLMVNKVRRLGQENSFRKRICVCGSAAHPQARTHSFSPIITPDHPDLFDHQ